MQRKEYKIDETEQSVETALAAAKQAVPRQPDMVYDWWRRSMKPGTTVIIDGNKVENVAFLSSRTEQTVGSIKARKKKR